MSKITLISTSDLEVTIISSKGILTEGNILVNVFRANK